MYYRLCIVREDGMVTAEFQDPESGWRKGFDITTVIGDYLSTECKRKGKPGRPQTYYQLDGHIFDEAWSRVDPAWMDYGVDDIRESFKFLKCALKLLNASNLSFFKKEAMLNVLRNESKLRLNFQANMCDTEVFEADSVKSFNRPISCFDKFSKPKSNVEDIDTWFEYECLSVSDMVVAIIHYYMVYGFKVIPCKHCGRVFATQSLKTVYCNRISPYKNDFSQKKSRPEPCKDTVKREIQFLRKKKDRLLDRIRNSSDVMRGYTEDVYDKLRQECSQYMDLVSKAPTPENFEKFNYYLECVAQKKEWKR